MGVQMIRQRDARESISTIDIVHKKVHEGLHFSTSWYEKLGAGSAMNILVTAPAAGEYDFTAEINTDGPGMFTFSKAPNATATNGTVITAFNNDEASINVSTLAHVANGTYTSSGTVLMYHVIGGSSGIGALQMVMGGDSMVEIELAPSSVHLLRFVADLASCRTVISTHFYREE